jgi:hypothetical protein
MGVYPDKNQVVKNSFLACFGMIIAAEIFVILLLFNMFKILVIKK